MFDFGKRRDSGSRINIRRPGQRKPRLSETLSPREEGLPREKRTIKLKMTA